MSKFRPVVFDCDGVLVDSEELGWAALDTVVGRYGLSVTPSDRAALAGLSWTEDYAHFAAKGTLPEIDDMWAELSVVMADIFERKLQAFEDAVDTLDALEVRSVPIAVASNSNRERLDVSLVATHLADFFQHSVAGDEVDRPKPAPDVYLRAAELLGVPASDCVAVEDTPTGIASAKAAGMRVVAVDRGEHALEELSEADAVVPRLTPISVLVEKGDRRP